MIPGLLAHYVRRRCENLLIPVSKRIPGQVGKVRFTQLISRRLKSLARQGPDKAKADEEAEFMIDK